MDVVSDAIDPCQWNNHKTCETTCHVGGCQNHVSILPRVDIVKPAPEKTIRLTALPVSLPSQLAHTIFHPPKTLA